MLGPIRKFSTSIYAKVLLAVIIIPFVFWGMGGLSSGNKNIVVIIDKEKYTSQQFTNFINRTATGKVESGQVEQLLSAFIGEKLIEKEIEYFGIQLNDNSLAQLIKHQKGFKRDNEFSRTEYEKFLLKNNITAVTFETILSKEEKKKQLLDLIGGGVSPSNFLVNIAYDNVNQKRSIELINLNQVVKKKLNFSQNEIETFFNNNKDRYSEIFKTVKIIELDPEKLIDTNEFTDLFFKKIDEIDNMVINGESIDNIVSKFSLNNPESITINEKGLNLNSLENKNFSKDITKKIFEIDENEITSLIEHNNKYFLIGVTKTENINKRIENISTKKEVILDLERKTKRIFISEFMAKINKNEFNKSDFDKLSKDENVNIQKINLDSRNDNKILKKDVINQVYSFPENKLILVNDMDFSENFLIYIDKISNVKISNDSKEFEKYLSLSRSRIVNDLYNTYDDYLKKKYKIDINYQGLDLVKNYFN